ncbi:zinc-dependent peptidase [Massilia agilis]|uniref:Zinc-dependent peptidase n=1 Tax=Massilia agilis TaxID=1811226 RepID=A0ABT2DAV0_9BURK|nr:M90 family metallopeptidase [Massilia agilis]MCS0808268.1 zinc-dependent peptidase [Massilia agilis]
MEGLVLAVLAALAVLAWLVPRWRLRRALAQPFEPERLAIIERNVGQYRGMGPEQRAELVRLVQQFLLQKKFVGCAGLELTDEMRVTIAAQACLLLMGRPTKVFRGLHTILVYPGAFLVPRRQVDAAGVVTEERQDLLGESWGDGRVILSWDHVRRWDNEVPHGQNVVLHEFAHQLDSESGSNNGAPWLGARERYRRWSEVLGRNFESLRADAWYGQHGVLDHYGANSPAEFFAVATESFFEQPYRLAARHPDLFDEFVAYFRVDPRAWFPSPLAEEPHAPGMVYGQWH